MGGCSRAAGGSACVYCNKSMGSASLDNAYKKALAAAAQKKAVFSGWTCLSGPSELVHFLVKHGKTVSYRTFAKNVDLKTANLDLTQRRLLPTDWHVTFLRSKLPSGALAWVMQHSHIEHLFLPAGTKFDQVHEAGLIP